MRRMGVMLALLGGMSAEAAQVVRQVEFAADAEQVWATLGPFCAIGAWHPAIAQCAIGPGPRRTLTTRDGVTLVERELERDDAAMRYAYTIESGPLPVSDDYRAVFSVVDRGDRTEVTWRAGFTPSDGVDDAAAEARIGALFDAGLEGMRRVLNE